MSAASNVVRFPGFEPPKYLDNRDVALAWAERGVRVFPCQAPDDEGDPRAKSPYPGVKWQDEATTSTDKVSYWWSRFPNALVGINLVDQRIIIIDVDGNEGQGQWAALCAEHGDPGAPYVLTPGGGRHYGFRLPEGVEHGNSIGSLRPKKEGGAIDVRGPGAGYIIGAGSMYPDLRIYSAVGGDLFCLLDAPDLPAWLLTILKGSRAPAETAAPLLAGPAPAPRPAPAARSDLRDHMRVQAWAETGFRAELDAMRAAGKGSRNIQLNTSSFNIGQLVGGGFVDRGLAENALIAAAQDNGYGREDPLGTRKTIRSGLESGTRSPRELPAEIRAEIEADQDAVERGRAAAAPALAQAADGTIHDEETGEIIDAPERERESLIPVVCAASFAGQPVPEQEWIVRDLIPARDITTLGGDGGVGKSLLALQLAVAIATGAPWIGLGVTRGRAVYLSGEDGVDEVHRRLHKLAPDLAALRDLFVLPLAGRDAMLAEPDQKGVLRTTKVYSALRGVLTELRPDLLIIDNLIDTFAGDEIKRLHARQFVTYLRDLCLSFGATVLMLYHPSAEGLRSGSGASGSTGWSNSVRSRLFFKRTPDGDADSRELTLEKANRASVGSKIALRYSEGCFVRESPNDAACRDKDARAASVFLDLLSEFERQNRHVSDRHSSIWAPKLFADHPDSKGVTKKDFQRAMDRLLRDGRIAVEIVDRHRQLVIAGDDWAGVDGDEADHAGPNAGPDIRYE
jgi:RecA-family ATPase